MPHIPLGEVPWLIPHLGEEVSWYFLPEGPPPPPPADEWLGNEWLSSLATYVFISVQVLKVRRVEGPWSWAANPHTCMQSAPGEHVSKTQNRQSCALF